MEKRMKKRMLAGLGLLLIDVGVFAATLAFLPSVRSFGSSGPWSYFVNSRARWDIAWTVLVATVITSVGLFLLLEALSVFKESNRTIEP
jgi:hypothetical protein